MATATAPSHIGLICFSGTGHVNPIVALGAALQARGHSVSFIGMVEYEMDIQAAGFGFIALGAEKQPLGTLRRLDDEMGDKTGKDAMDFAIARQAVVLRIEMAEMPGPSAPTASTSSSSTPSTAAPSHAPSTRG